MMAVGCSRVAGCRRKYLRSICQPKEASTEAVFSSSRTRIVSGRLVSAGWAPCAVFSLAEPESGADCESGLKCDSGVSKLAMS
jgi:hypothetical protein